MDNKAIRNYILPTTVEKLGVPYKPKKNLYLLVTILENLIFYRNRVIYIKIKPLELKIKG